MSDFTPPVMKVLIADDELLVRQGLKKLINWSEFGMEVVSDVPNGSRAWEEYLRHRPGLIITDIVMPHMDGVELARKIREIDPRAKFIFLSCHNDFAYAQEALRIGVSEYILKTDLEEEEMGHILCRIRAGLARPAGNERREPDLLGRFVQLWQDWTADESLELLPAFEKLARSKWPSLAVSDSAVFHVVTHDKLDLPRLAEGIRPFHPDRDRFAALKLDDNQWMVWCSREWYPYMNDELSTACRKGSILSREVVDGVKGIKPCLEAVRHLYKRWLYRNRYQVSLTEQPLLMVNALDYIMRHLSSPLSVSEISDAVGLSRSYFSVLFKKSTGCGLLEFVNERRLELAQYYLKSTEWTVKEIGEQTGMFDAKYFSKWFRKKTGVTPSAYRNEIKLRGESNNWTP